MVKVFLLLHGAITFALIEWLVLRVLICGFYSAFDLVSQYF